MENKRDLWDFFETQYLIKLLNEKNILKIMDSKRFRVAEIFKSLESDMKKKGYDRSAMQIQIKFKALKQSYNNTRNKLSKSGAGAIKKCKFYDELHELFGYRPVSFQKGIDSINEPTCDLNMYDNKPDSDGAIPGSSGCSSFCQNFDNNNDNIRRDSLSMDSTQDSLSMDSTHDLINIDSTQDPLSMDSTQDSLSMDSTQDSLNMVKECDKLNCAMLDNKENINAEKSKNEKLNKKRNLSRSTNRQTFSQVFDSCIEKLIKSNEDIARNTIENQNKIISNIIEQQKYMVQQTQLLINNLQARNVNPSAVMNQFPHSQALTVSPQFYNSSFRKSTRKSSTISRKIFIKNNSNINIIIFITIITINITNITNT